jgi:polyhydroxybutyrate depolymerase
VNGCEQTGKDWDKAGQLVGTVYESKGGTPFVSLVGPGGHEFPKEAPKLIVKFFKEHEQK